MHTSESEQRCSSSRGSTQHSKVLLDLPQYLNALEFKELNLFKKGIPILEYLTQRNEGVRTGLADSIVTLGEPRDG